MIQFHKSNKNQWSNKFAHGENAGKDLIRSPSQIPERASSCFGIKPLRGFFPTSAGHHRRLSKSAFCWRRSRFLWYGVAYESELSTRRRITKIAQPSVVRFALFVIRLGFEPKTHSLEGCCSIQLSYRTILILRNEAARMKADCKYT